MEDFCPICGRPDGAGHDLKCLDPNEQVVVATVLGMKPAKDPKDSIKEELPSG
jgi:hypothetical protein